MYLIGNDICFNRIRNIRLTKTGEQTAFVKSRTLWVEVLKRKKEKTDNWISVNEDIWYTMYNKNIANNALTKCQLGRNVLNCLEILNSSQKMHYNKSRSLNLDKIITLQKSKITTLRVYHYTAMQ